MINSVYFCDPLVLIYVLLFFRALSFICNAKHLLSILLSLEAIIMGLYCYRVVSISYTAPESYTCLVVLTFGACEAAVGLSILVNIISCHGSSYVNSLSLRQC